MNSIPTNQQMSTESPLVIHTGSLLSNLDQETQARVLELRYMKSPLVETKNLYSSVIQKALEKIGYLDIEQGKFIRTKIDSGSAKLGPMGWSDTYGYTKIKVLGFTFCQSHLIYLWINGRLPVKGEEIDHLDGNPSNDCLTNLRIVSHLINGRNKKMNCRNSSGYNGVSWDSKANKYRARTIVNKKFIHHGFFVTAEKAYAAKQAYIATHPELGFTMRHGT